VIISRVSPDMVLRGNKVRQANREVKRQVVKSATRIVRIIHRPPRLS